MYTSICIYIYNYTYIYYYLYIYIFFGLSQVPTKTLALLAVTFHDGGLLCFPISDSYGNWVYWSPFVTQPNGHRLFFTLLCGGQLLLRGGCLGEWFSLWNRRRLWDPRMSWWPWVFICCLVLFRQGLLGLGLRHSLLVVMASSFTTMGYGSHLVGSRSILLIMISMWSSSAVLWIYSLALGVLSWCFSSYGPVKLMADSSNCSWAQGWDSIRALGT